MSPWMHLCSVAISHGAMWQSYVADGARTGQGLWFHGMLMYADLMTAELGLMLSWIGSRLHGRLHNGFCSSASVGHVLAQSAIMDKCSIDGKPESILRMKTRKFSSSLSALTVFITLVSFCFRVVSACQVAQFLSKQVAACTNAVE